MHARSNEPSVIPAAPFDDLDLDRPEDGVEWDANGDLVFRKLPPDMLPDSDTTLETG